MNRKWLGIILIIVGFLLVLIITYIFFFHQFGTPDVVPVETETPVASLPASNIVETPSAPIVVTPVKTSVSGNDLKKMGASFAERFGSFSNQSNYENISDLKLFMTESMKVWADDFIAKSQKDYSGIYYGISTTAVSEEVRSFDDSGGTGVILVKTQRRESTGQMSNSAVFYQSLLISYKKVDGAWKVDRAEWQPKI
jgi:hypothetical protein